MKAMGMSGYSYLMGVDGGGTKSEALLVRSDGGFRGWGHCDVAEAGSVTAGGRSVLVIQTAIRRALVDLPPNAHLTVFHAATHLPQDAIMPPEFQGRFKLVTSSESFPMLSLTPGRVGIVALAGTGSHVSGRNGRGQERICDGLGPNFGDFGGASRMGVQALRAAAMAAWHPRHQTSLRPAVLRACRTLDGQTGGDINLIDFFHRPRDRWQIASLARIVSEEAERGDRVARQILEESAESMSAVIYDVADSLGLCRREFPLIGIGSVILRSRIFWDHLRRCVSAFAPRIRPTRLLIPPVFGIVLKALLDRSPGEARRIRSHLFTSAAAVLPQWPAAPLSVEPRVAIRPGRLRKQGALDCFIVN